MIDWTKVKPGDHVRLGGEFEVVEVPSPSPDVRVRLTDGRVRSFLRDVVVKHLPREFEAGDPVRYLGEKWEVAAGPKQRKDGVREVSLWSEKCGYVGAEVSDLERI